MATLKVLLLLSLAVLSLVAETFGRVYPIEIHYQKRPQRYHNNGDAATGRVKRHHYGHGSGGGVTGPVYTFVKTDKHANFKWGVRHNVGHKYA